MDMTRRRILAGAAGLSAALATGGCATRAETRPMPKFAYVGCYTTQRRNGRGEGVSVFSIDPGTLNPPGPPSVEDQLGVLEKLPPVDVIQNRSAARSEVVEQIRAAAAKMRATRMMGVFMMAKR